jgi:hypothetical protein
MSRSRRLLVEFLEDRCVPANWGMPWPDASHLTLSFAPDNTPVGGGQLSTLFKTLTAVAPTAVWEKDVLLAFQTWAVESNINIGLVNDGAQALGASGRPQGDPRFGDIRIAAGAFANDILAYTQPYDPTAGTWSGDVRLNTTMPVGLSSTAAYDFLSLMIHEAGHSFGLPDNGDPTSVMESTYHGVDTALSASDIASLQAIYGVRAPDTTNNNTPATATPLSFVSNSSGLLSAAVGADLSSQTDVDCFCFTTPLVTGGLVVQLLHNGLSLLTPQVTVYNSSGQVVGSAVSTDPTSGDLTIQVGGLPLSTYYVKVQGATGTVFDVGSYYLNVESLPVLTDLTNALLATLGSVEQALTARTSTNISFATAQNLSSSSASGTPTLDSHQGNIVVAGTANYYIVQAPAQSTGANVMTISLWSSAYSSLSPSLTLFDANQKPITAQVLANEGGSVTLQLASVTPGAWYYIKTGSTVSSGAGSTGMYTVSVDFGTAATAMQTYASGQLTAATPQQSGTLAVQETNLFHFVLAVAANDGTNVAMTIRNSAGQVVGQLIVTNGTTSSLTLTLDPDTYTIQLTAFRTDGNPITPVQFSLLGDTLGEKMGATASDTSGSSTGGSSSSDNSTYTWSSGSTSFSGGSSTNPYGTGYSA